MQVGYPGKPQTRVGECDVSVALSPPRLALGGHTQTVLDLHPGTSHPLHLKASGPCLVQVAPVSVVPRKAEGPLVPGDSYEPYCLPAG